MAGISLEPSRDQMLDLGSDAVRVLVEFLSTLDKRATVPDPGVAPPEVSLFGEDGAPVRDVLQETLRAAEHAVETAGPRHFGFIPGGGLFTSAVAEMLARGFNRYVPAAVMASVFAAIERAVVDWFRDVLGLPGTAGGLLTTGGSSATLSAIIAARYDRLGADTTGGVYYVTEHTNHCVEKAALIGGLPASAARLVPTTARLSMDPAALRALISADREQGHRPFLVVATAGTTGTGTVDDLTALADIARDEGLWLHVDAAYGGFFALTERGRGLFGGLGRADSVVLDPHKSLFLPYGTGAVLVRDVRVLARAHTPPKDVPPYLRDLDRDADEPPDLADLGVERSREFRGLRVWLPLRVHGVRAFRAALDEKLDLAWLAYQELSANPALDCPLPPELSTVVFRSRAGDAATHALRDRINASGLAFCSGTQLHEGYYLRMCVLSFRTHLEHVRTALDVIHAAAGVVGVPADA
jgi:aromatic-L-amino-acid decarboxylase